MACRPDLAHGACLIQSMGLGPHDTCRGSLLYRLDLVLKVLLAAQVLGLGCKLHLARALDQPCALAQAAFKLAHKAGCYVQCAPRVVSSTHSTGSSPCTISTVHRPNSRTCAACSAQAGPRATGASTVQGASTGCPVC